MNLDGYVTVPERLRMALERYPDLRIQEEGAHVETTPAGEFLVCIVRVWRSPDDPLPVVASAAEPIPGRTAYTKNAERMVGFTSALGRALGYMGLGLSASIASADEVRVRERERDHLDPPSRVERRVDNYEEIPPPLDEPTEAPTIRSEALGGAPRTSGARLASEKQWGAIRAIAARKGLAVPALKYASEASEWIEANGEPRG